MLKHRQNKAAVTIRLRGCEMACGIKRVPRGIDHLGFEDWVYFVFDRPAEGPQWYWGDEAPFWNAPAELTATYVTKLFEEPFPALEGFRDPELNMGLTYLISAGLGEHMRCLDEPSVPLAIRLRCVGSCESLFRKLLLPRCSPHLSHSGEPSRSPLNAVCYMWWDTMPVHGGPVLAERHALQLAALETMARILRLDSLACQESALHGLGHWHSVFPEPVESLVDDFLSLHPNARPELLTYARGARCGCVL
jgi:hypothetical protein